MGNWGVDNWFHVLITGAARYMTWDMKKKLKCKTQTKVFFLIMLTDDCSNKNNSVNYDFHESFC